MQSRSLAPLTCLCLASSLSAQLNTTPAVRVEDTRAAILAAFTPGPATQTVTSRKAFANFRLHLEYQAPAGATAELQLRQADPLRLPPGEPGSWQVLDLTWEQVDDEPVYVSASVSGKTIAENQKVDVGGGRTYASTAAEAKKIFRFDRDFTALVRFQTRQSGTLVAKCGPTGKWVENAKALFVNRSGRLVYDIGWLGEMSGGPKVNDGKAHTAVLVSRGDKVELFLDGKSIARKKAFSRPDVDGHVLKFARSAPDFGFDFKGRIDRGTFWARALGRDEIQTIFALDPGQIRPPDLDWTPTAAESSSVGIPGVATPIELRAPAGFKLRRAWVQPLARVDHAGLIAALDVAALQRGRKIYHTLCVTCHGTPTKEGTLPTALKFHAEPFKNGSDPYRMYQTLERGFGLMVPQAQYTAAQKYDVVHYIRETLVRPHNPGQYAAVDRSYLNALPRKASRIKEAPTVADRSGPQFKKMNFGPALAWTYQVAPGNIAYKAIAVRLDDGPGGVSKGRAWMVYDHDTLRMAAAYRGDAFVDWRGIAFDGSHGTHTSIVGDKAFVNPVGPGWADPATGSWEDKRLRGRDGRPYGPLPRAWAHYKGIYYHGNQVVIAYTVGNVKILEMPGWIGYGTTPIYTRTLNIGRSSQDLAMRVAPASESLTVAVAGTTRAKVVTEDGFSVLRIPATATPTNLKLLMSPTTDATTVQALGTTGDPAPDLTPYTRGGPPRWDQPVTTQGRQGSDDGPFAVDVLTAPDASANPWESWMRLGGFDFFPGGQRAAVCTWMGDVWIVDGIGGEIGTLRWKRIATGLFQGLGLKIVEGKIYATCRDQIARLHDLNGDEEIDFIESFNNDHQVTEHFHEFAMGLQTDDAGNFYYAKSARHALKAVVPHHGTLLRVSPDGAKTDIVATGFRAANGVCLNPDGTWIVTDQEGHWNPKNRINYVREGGFYGNMYGYHDVTDSSDAAMQQPLCWITNAFDRSPAELLWVPKSAKWGPLNGVLLNLSYGYGKIYTVPHEVIGGQAQGGMCQLPIPQFATGVMRGRFHPANGQLYGAGLFAWAGSQRQPGGFYRIRYTGKSALVPLGLKARAGGMEITFSDPLDPTATDQRGNFRVKTWDLKRTKSYGSKHYNIKELKVASARLSDDRRSLLLSIPEIQPTWGMEIRCRIQGADGQTVERVIHNTIHQLP